MRLLFGVAAAAALATAAAAPAQDSFVPSGSIRLRHEVISGQARAGFASDDDLTSVRTTLGGEYRSGGFRVGAELYDSRAYGAGGGTPLTNAEVNSVELVQAYVATRLGDANGGGTAATFTAGRMLLNVGSRRLVAADDYRNTTNSYTGVRADIAGPRGLSATLIYMLPQYRRPDDFASLRDNDVAFDRESFDLVLWGGTAALTTAIGRAGAELTFYHLGEDDSPALATRNRSLDIAGGRVVAEPAAAAFDYEVEGFYQWGTIRSGVAPTAATLAVSATFVHAEAGYTFATTWRPRLAIEFDRASGDRAGGRYARFDTLFGMRRADFAPSGIYSTTGRANIVAAGFRAEAAPGKRLDGFVTYKALWPAASADSFATTGVRGRPGDFAGHQIEGRVRYWLVPATLRFEFDGAFLVKGSLLRAASATRRTARYASFNLTAQF